MNNSRKESLLDATKRHATYKPFHSFFPGILVTRTFGVKCKSPHSTEKQTVFQKDYLSTDLNIFSSFENIQSSRAVARKTL